MALQDILWLATGSVIGVGASLIVASLPELLRALRARSVTRERLGEKPFP